MNYQVALNISVLYYHVKDVVQVLLSLVPL